MLTPQQQLLFFHCTHTTNGHTHSKHTSCLIQLVNHIIKVDKLENYLEIGCQENNLFHSVTAVHKTGVDPERGGTHRMTSDQFFAQNNKKFDFIFIDGMHTYEQVHVDIKNSIKVLKLFVLIKPNGCIHGCIKKLNKDKKMPLFDHYFLVI